MTSTHTPPATTADLAAEALTDEGDSLTLPDGRMLCLIVETDYDTDVRDFDCYGRFAEYSQSHRDQVDRPADMDGSARKLKGFSNYVWWTPPEGFADADRDTQHAIELDACERWEWGFSLVGVRLLEPVTDSRGGSHMIEVDTAYCGGVDEVYPELVADLAGEVLAGQ